ncbi:MAG: DNA starvation/stationary phase protection protein [Rickettsiales bacterium]|nr:MAG: DNA starvation/stationary phase protection protein [Rickettsiales bacterium]
MENQKVVESLKTVLINSYSLYLKTQNYHWNVVGANFKSLHELFEQQYQDLQDAVDLLAERIRALGDFVPATLNEYNAQKIIADGNRNYNSNEMLKDLVDSQDTIISLLKDLIKVAEENNDAGTADMATLRIEIHQKNRWMLDSSIVR